MQRHLAPALAALTLSSLAAAQTGPSFYVSTTSDVAAAAGVPAVLDGDLVLVQEGAPATVVRALGHWRATAGADVGDVDALARRPGTQPGMADSIVFSVVSDFGAFDDGDVLGLKDGGGVEVVLAESALTGPLGLALGSIDVDALAYDASARLHFSLQNDALGTALGDVLDGDVLRLNADGSVQRVLTEAEVDQKLAQATGSTSAAGDVLGLEIVGGEIFASVQSPSGYDGGVIDCGATPSVVLTDAGAGLGGAEIDAFMLVVDADVLPNVRTEPASSPTGGTVHVEFRGQPGEGLLVMWAGDAGYLPFFGPGFGAWYVDPADPWLQSIFTGPTLPLVPLDGTGFYGIDYTLPLGVEGTGLDGKPGWTFQTMSLSTLELSEPFRLELF